MYICITVGILLDDWFPKETLLFVVYVRALKTELPSNKPEAFSCVSTTNIFRFRSSMFSSNVIII